jgi:hypothetical protein
MRFAPMALGLMVAVPAASDVVEGVWSSPAADRWMYPFNSTPGTRSSLSVFGSDREVPSQFDARDGQILLAFDVVDQLPSGDEALDWSVVEAEVTLQVQNDLVFRHDPTADAWTDFLPASDARRTEDSDAGQPVELAAVGFRNGWTRETFQETSPFTSAPGSVLSPAMRNAFAAQVDGNGVPQDISNHPRQGFQPAVFAVGRVDGLASGAPVPTGSLMRFQIDLTLPGVQAYLRQGLRQGRLWFSLSSLSIVQQQAGAFPVFHARESALVQFGLAQAASLRVRVERTPACDAADLDCNGMVDAADIGALLVRFGACPGGGQLCTGDLDGSGTVDAADIGAMLIRFG